MLALIMAGGKGRRLGINGVEKPLLEFKGVPFIARVHTALVRSRIDDVIVVTSPNTPRTTQWAENSNIKVITAPGEGYIRDYGWAIKRLRLRGPVLIVSADLPLITDQVIDRIIDCHAESQRPALTVCVPDELYKATKRIPDLTVETGHKVLIPVGVNVVDGDLIDDVQEEAILVIRDEALLYNINRRADLERLPRE